MAGRMGTPPASGVEFQGAYLTKKGAGDVCPLKGKELSCRQDADRDANQSLGTCGSLRSGAGGRTATHPFPTAWPLRVVGEPWDPPKFIVQFAARVAVQTTSPGAFSDVVQY